MYLSSFKKVSFYFNNLDYKSSFEIIYFVTDLLAPNINISIAFIDISKMIELYYILSVWTVYLLEHRDLFNDSSYFIYYNNSFDEEVILLLINLDL